MKTFKEFADEMDLGGVSKQVLKNRIYKTISPLTKGFFSDQDWSNVNRIFKTIEAMGLDFVLTKTDYYKGQDGITPAGKIWNFEIPFTNQRGRPDKLYGTLTAAGAGSVQDPLERYDITVMMG